MENWPEFRELFMTMIHDNNKLRDVQKLQYLKTHVLGAPAELIKHLQLTGNNYETAWNFLNQRYNNTRIHIFNQLQRFTTMKYVHNERADEIKSLLDTTKEILYSLKNHGENVAAWNCWVASEHWRVLRRKMIDSIRDK